MCLQLVVFNDEGQSKWSEVVVYRIKLDRSVFFFKLQIKGKIYVYNFRVVWGENKIVLFDEQIFVFLFLVLL